MGLSRIHEVMNMMEKRNSLFDRISSMPVEHTSSLLDWFVKSKKYVNIYGLRREIGKDISDLISSRPTSISEWEFIIKKEKSVVLKTLFIVLSPYNDQIIHQYLNNNDTKIIGLALAIHRQVGEIVFKSGDDEAIILYCTEYRLDLEQFTIDDPVRVIAVLKDRIQDSSKTMYTMLVYNLHFLLNKNGYSAIDSKFISTYIDHSLINEERTDSFLLDLLVKCPSHHPDFSKMQSLGWDPYSKSRRFSHWLNARKKIESLKNHYEQLDPEKNIFKKSNWDYIDNFSKFKEQYDICFRF